MTRTARHRPVHSAAIAALFLVSLCGCAHPLAPGYQVQKEALAVRFVPGNPPHLAVRADYRLVNAGDSLLNSVAVSLPGEKSFGFANPRAEVDGKAISLQQNANQDSNPSSAASLWRILLPAPWRQKQRINLALTYDIAAQQATDARIFVAANTFYLNDSGWFPVFQEPKALLATDITRPNPTDLSVTVPSDFHVTASGQPAGKKNRGGETEYRSRIHKDDFDPYVLAGQYHEQRVSSGGLAVAVWTFKPIPADQVQNAAAQIAAAQKFYVQNFGHLPKSMDELLDVDLPNEAANTIVNHDPAWASLLPGVVSTVSEGLSAPTGLAHTWFAHLIVPRPEAWTLAEGLDFYASTLSSPGATQITNGHVGSVLSDYDANKAHAVEKAVISLTPADPQVQLQIGRDKIHLFFFALEDKCSQQNLTHAIADMVYALRGQEYGYSDFRAALEQQCHQNLAGLFRTWLTQPGIPPDFRARYENAGAK